MASNAGGAALLPTGTKRKRGGRKAAGEAANPTPASAASKPENGSGDGPTPRKRGKGGAAASAAAAAAAAAMAVPEPVKIEEVVTTASPGKETKRLRVMTKVNYDSIPHLLTTSVDTRLVKVEECKTEVNDSKSTEKVAIDRPNDSVKDTSLEPKAESNIKPGGDLGNFDNEITLEVKVKSDSVKAEPDIKAEEHWAKPDIEMLLDRLTSSLPAEDAVRYNTQADRIDWEKIRFSNYTAADCKRQWNLIITKVRRFRTMTELLSDAKTWAKQPWTSFNKKQSKHPDMPKKPLTPYFRYFMEKRAKYSQQHPDLSMTEISMVLAQRYRALPDKKKQKYIDSYNKENEQYKVLLGKFKEEHPDLYQDLEADKSHKKDSSGRALPSIIAGAPGGPPKSTTPMQLYIEAKTEEHRKKDPSLTKKEYYDLYKMKWSELPDSKKLKYINKAVEIKSKYDDAMDVYIMEHPEYKPKPSKSFLNKYEQKIKDKNEGKPEKPPPNGYGLFTSQVLSKLTEIPSNERMAEVSRRWKALKEEDREKFNKNAVQKMNEYKSLMQIYLRKLPESEREKLTADGKKLPRNSSKLLATAATAAANAQGRPKQPISALFLFVNEKRDRYRAKHPGMDHQELTRLIAKEYTALPPDKKAKYKKMEEEHKQQITTNSVAPSATTSRGKNVQFPGEPRKPPGSGYQLFSTEMLVKLKDIHSQQRMAVISEKWKAMTEASRNAYKAKREKLWAKYYADLKKFKASLSRSDLALYEELVDQRKHNLLGLSKADAAKYEELELQRKIKRTTPNAPKPGTKKAAPVKKEVESEDDDSSDDDSDDDSDSGDDNDSDDSDSDSGSDDESEAEPPKPVQNGPSKEVEAAADDSDSDSESEAESGSDVSSEVSGSSDSGSESASASESESDSD